MSITKAEYEYFVARNGTVLTQEVANKLYELGRLAQDVYLSNIRIAHAKMECEAKAENERWATLYCREELECWLGRE